MWQDTNGPVRLARLRSIRPPNMKKKRKKEERMEDNEATGKMANCHVGMSLQSPQHVYFLGGITFILLRFACTSSPR